MSPIKKNNFVAISKHGGGVIMVWSYFTPQGPKRHNGTMNFTTLALSQDKN